MQISLLSQPAGSIETGALILIAFEEQKSVPDVPVADLLFESGEFKGKLLDLTLLHAVPGFAARRVLLAGGGAAAQFDANAMRKLSGAAVRFLKGKSIATAALVLDGDLAKSATAQAAVEGAILGDYEPDTLKSDKSGSKHLDAFAIACESAGLDEAVGRGRIIAESQNFTRDLVNEPGNRLTPMVLAARAREMAAEAGLACDVLDQDRMRQLGMGSLLGVAIGSAEPPALIVIEYKPENPASGAKLGLVGKGVTFDTGGISIKPSDGMEKMKYDMAGGAAVLGAMRAIARLKPPVAVTALVPAVENMPGSRAQRPGDIVTAMNGKTIEVLNTDAEGRLILADALCYARQLGCTHLVDAATLTGAIVVALGTVNIGAFSSDDALASALLASANGQGEKTWRLPIDAEYKEQLKSPFADLGNIGGRHGGAITAALFLKEFADPAPWVHLDIAGTAWIDDAKPHLSKGPSGVGVRTFVDLAMNWKS